MDIDPIAEAEVIEQCKKLMAKAKSEKSRLEHYLKIVKSTIMQSSDAKTVAAKEVEAFTSKEYKQAVDDLTKAIYDETYYGLTIEKAKIKGEIWRTISANNRALDRIIR